MAAKMNDNEFIRKFNIFSQENGIFVAKWRWIFLTLTNLIRLQL